MSNTVPVQQAIKFLHLQISKVDFTNKLVGNQFLPSDLDLKFSFSTSALSDNSTGVSIDYTFCVKYVLMFTDKNGIINLTIEANAIFESTTLITEDFLQSDFATLNAPAISFPFLRAFIANFTLNAGYNTIMLPAFNFSKAKEIN